MCHLSKKDQYVCQINQGIAEAVTGVLGGAQFPLCPFYHPRSSRCRLGHTREADVWAGNVPDSNGISGDFKRQKRSHQTEPVPWDMYVIYILMYITAVPNRNSPPSIPLRESFRDGGKVRTRTLAMLSSCVP